MSVQLLNGKNCAATARQAAKRDAGFFGCTGLVCSALYGLNWYKESNQQKVRCLVGSITMSGRLCFNRDALTGVTVELPREGKYVKAVVCAEYRKSTTDGTEFVEIGLVYGDECDTRDAAAGTTPDVGSAAIGNSTTLARFPIGEAVLSSTSAELSKSYTDETINDVINRLMSDEFDLSYKNYYSYAERTTLSNKFEAEFDGDHFCTTNIISDSRLLSLPGQHMLDRGRLTLWVDSMKAVIDKVTAEWTVKEQEAAAKKAELNSACSAVASRFASFKSSYANIKAVRQHAAGFSDDGTELKSIIRRGTGDNNAPVLFSVTRQEVYGVYYKKGYSALLGNRNGGFCFSDITNSSGNRYLYLTLS